MRTDVGMNGRTVLIDVVTNGRTVRTHGADGRTMRTGVYVQTNEHDSLCPNDYGRVAKIAYKNV